jgi:hypothetical protein
MKVATIDGRLVRGLGLYLLSVIIVGVFLQCSGLLRRAELQQINREFEWRYWMLWNATSLARLNPNSLLRYHDQHEINRSPASWDYTLSWLIENNHPRRPANIVIFNHEVEDEPPAEALIDHPWMQALAEYPISRKSVAEMIRTLAASGAHAIIVDNDFPQHRDGDRELASALHDCATGRASGRPVPVYMIKSVYRNSSANLEFAQAQTTPSGVLKELQKLEPQTDVAARYTGTSGLYADEDQVVRRFVARFGSVNDGDSVALKVLRATTGAVSAVPDIFDINFLGPPNSPIFPVRPLSYLFDPERKSALLNPPPDYQDVSVKDAIVIIGDGLADTFATPYCNQTLAPMSGSEVLANAIDTIVESCE